MNAGQGDVTVPVGKCECRPSGCDIVPVWKCECRLMECNITFCKTRMNEIHKIFLQKTLALKSIVLVVNIQWNLRCQTTLKLNKSVFDKKND